MLDDDYDTIRLNAIAYRGAQVSDFDTFLSNLKPGGIDTSSDDYHKQQIAKLNEGF